MIAFPWGNEDTQNLIDIFDQYNVKATFFVVGEWVDKYPESVKALADAGHEVMGHSNNHAHFNTLSADEIIADINTCNDKIEAVTGVRPTLFRPPFGEYDDHVVSTVRGMDLEIIQWDVELLAASAMPWGTRVCGLFFPSFLSLKAAPMKGAALLAGMHRSKVFFSQKLKQFQLGFRQLFLDMSSFLCTKLFLDMLTQIYNFKILHMYLQQTFLSSFRTVILRRHLYQTAMPVELYNCGSEFLPQLQSKCLIITRLSSRRQK
ncbi:polysaccharide deacetylase family protein [Evtepia sp.]|uniref:polysaccharide deacetylase family protein n=1 Tax=Evtepia sp. TaxID=2773933 RepID=UPI003F1810BD